MKKIVMALIAITTISTFANTASEENKQAANTSNTSFESFYDKLKKSPLGLLYYGKVSPKRDGYDFKGFSTLNLFILDYKLTDKDKIAFETRLYTDSENNDKTDWNRAILRYKRSILNQKDHGIGLSASLDLRYYPEAESRFSKASSGHIRPSLTISRSFGKLSSSLGYYYANSFRKGVNKPAAEVGKRTNAYHWVLGSLNYPLSDKFTAYSYQEYFRTYRESKAEAYTEQADLTVGVDYALNKTMSIGADVGATLFKSFDGEVLAQNIDKGLSYGAYFSMKAF